LGTVAKQSKRYRAAKAKVPAEPQELESGLKLLNGFPKAKFDETVEVCLRLGIDAKKSEQLIRGAVSLPHGIGKKLRVIAFAEGDKAEEARKAGASEVGSGDLATKILGGWLDFDVAVATPDMMKHVGKLGKVLGPQGKMPSPKSGTVTMDVGTAVREFVQGKIEFRTDAGGNVHAPVGKRSFEPMLLADNIRALVNHVNGLRPPAAKGVFILKAVVSSTMSPGVQVRV
jgi:large subunit ribosomal protein L1